MIYDYYTLLIIYLIGIILVYSSTRNIFAFHFIWVCFLFPAAITSSIPVMNLFSFGILAIGIGCNVANFFKSFLPKSNLIYFKHKNISTGVYPTQIFIFSLFFALIISVLISTYYFNAVGISLFAEEVGRQRLIARHDVAGSYVFQRFFRVFIPILCMNYYLLSFCDETKKYYSTSVFLILILICSSFLLFTGLRGNLIIFIFFPFLVLLGLVSQKTSFLRIFLLFCLTFFGGLFVTVLMFPEDNLLSIFEIIFERLTSGASDGISFLVGSDIPSNGYYYGRTYFNDLMSLFSKLGLTSSQYQTLGEQIANTILGDNYWGEQASVFVMGELYANFGYIGLFIGSIFLGIFLQVMYILIIRSKKTVFLTPVFAYFLAIFIPILGGPSLSMFIDYSITLIFFIITFLTYVLLFSIPFKRFGILNKTFLIR